MAGLYCIHVDGGNTVVLGGGGGIHDISCVSGCGACTHILINVFLF